jgi:DNA-directed RNA polymerase subunit RPC12/RpoP
MQSGAWGSRSVQVPHSTTPPAEPISQDVNDSLIARSGQLALFNAGVVSVVVGTLVMMAAPRLHPAVPIYVGYPLGVVLAIGGTLFLATRVRCPHCRSRIIGDALTQRPSSLHDALVAPECRRCGYRPAA